jgi:hypothetical protein
LRCFRKDLWVSRLDAEIDLPAAGTFQEREKFLVHMLQTGDAIVADRNLFLLHQGAEAFHARAVEGEQIVIEKDVADAEVLVQVAEMLDDVFRGVEAEALAEYGTVAIAALVGAAPTGDDAGVGRFRVTEERQVVAPGKIWQEMVGGKRE